MRRAGPGGRPADRAGAAGTGLPEVRDPVRAPLVRAPNRQGLRCRGSTPGLPCPRDRPAHRAQRDREQRAARAPSLGRCLIALQASSRTRAVTAGSWLFPRSVHLTAAPCVSKRGSPCRARGPIRHRPQDPTRADPARVPAGTPLPALHRRISMNGSRARWPPLPHAVATGHGWNGVPARHIACSTTASLRATATAACLNPRRSTRARPQVLRAESSRTRTSRLAAASNR